MLYYSYSSYCPRDEVQQWDCKYCKKNPHFVLAKYDWQIKAGTAMIVGHDPATERSEFYLRNCDPDSEQLLWPFKGRMGMILFQCIFDEWTFA